MDDYKNIVIDSVHSQIAWVVSHVVDGFFIGLTLVLCLLVLRPLYRSGKPSVEQVEPAQPVVVQVVNVGSERRVVFSRGPGFVNVRYPVAGPVSLVKKRHSDEYLAAAATANLLAVVRDGALAVVGEDEAHECSYRSAQQSLADYLMEHPALRENRRWVAELQAWDAATEVDPFIQSSGSSDPKES